jgi:hypothetical protein
MKKPLGLAALILLTLAFAASPASADALGLDLGIHGGVVNTKDGEGGSFVGGAQARFHLFWIVAAEARASYYTDSYDLGQLGSVDIENIPFQVSGMIYPIKLPRVGVYLLGGGTYSNLKVKGKGVVQGEVTEKGWSAHVGAGLDLKIGEKTTLNGDVRFVYLDASSVNELIDSAKSNYKGDFWTATIGLNYKIF